MVYNKQGPLVTPQNKLLDRICKIAVDYPAEETDSLKVIPSLLYKLYFIYDFLEYESIFKLFLRISQICLKFEIEN